MIPERTPRHVAIVMDGNGRWAQRRGRPRVYGHIRGSSRIKAIVREADRLGVRSLTLYAFSTENWSRPSGELSVLWKLLAKYLLREADELARENVRLGTIGEIERLAPELRELLASTTARLAGNTGLRLNFAISYGSRKELLRATARFAKDCVEGKVRPDALDEKLFGEYLWTSHLGELADVDLVIRTSGELRTSNYLLWQSAYAEYYFTEKCWPDFSPEDLRAAIEDYGRRERRFGGVGKGAAKA